MIEYIKYFYAHCLRFIQANIRYQRCGRMNVYMEFKLSFLTYKQFAEQQVFIKAARKVADKRKQSNHDKYVAQTDSFAKDPWCIKALIKLKTKA